MPYAFTNTNDWKLTNALLIISQNWVEELDPAKRMLGFQTPVA
jgi:hypothetical protein